MFQDLTGAKFKPEFGRFKLQLKFFKFWSDYYLLKKCFPKRILQVTRVYHMLKGCIVG